MSNTIKLIVGLGNPGQEYANTRHNVGAWFAEQCAMSANSPLKNESKFFGLASRVSISGHACHVLIPTTYMNDSGKAVSALARFYKLTPEEILVAHDELDYDAGKIRVKQNGGHGGHNGLRDIIQHLGSDQFFRLRIGIGHPGHKDRVSPYVLSRPSAGDKKLIDESIAEGFAVLPDLLEGETEKAIRFLHSE